MARNSVLVRSRVVDIIQSLANLHLLTSAFAALMKVCSMLCKFFIDNAWLLTHNTLDYAVFH